MHPLVLGEKERRPRRREQSASRNAATDACARLLGFVELLRNRPLPCFCTSRYFRGFTVAVEGVCGRVILKLHEHWALGVAQMMKHAQARLQSKVHSLDECQDCVPVQRAQPGFRTDAAVDKSVVG